MSVGVSFGGGASDLVAALGLTGADGRLNGGWFDDPIGHARRVLADPVQRAALLRMLDSMLPAAADRPGWHPLLPDGELGNVYLTVEGDVIGAAAAVHGDPAAGIHVTASVRLPLVDVAEDLRPIAASAEGPVQLGVEVSFDDTTLPLRGIAVDVTIDVDRGAGFVARLTGVDLGGPPTDLVIDSAHLGADVLDAVRVLLDQALAAASGDPRVQQLADHLFALLGLTGGLPALPLDQLVANPEAVRDWLVSIVGVPANLVAWAAHLAGLVGSGAAGSGAGTAVSPFVAPLVSAGGVTLDLVVAVSDHHELQLGLGVTVATPVADLEASATIFSIPLGGGSTVVVPAASVLLVAPHGGGPLVDDAPTVHVDELRAGFRLDAGQVQPWLELTGVTLEGVSHGTVDLTSADAVTGVITAQVDGLLAQAFGDSDQAHALLALLGLELPAGYAGAVQRVDPLALFRAPLPTLATLHRDFLTEAGSWSTMLHTIGTLLGLPGDVHGAGTDAEPWHLPIAAIGPVTLSLAAWDAGDATTARLRIGLWADATVGPFTTSLRSELLAVDLPAAGSGRVALLGEQRVVLAFAPGAPITTALGLTAGVDSVTGTARWRPGDPLTWAVDIAGLSVRTGTESFGPFTWSWPGGTGPDLGPIGLGVVRLLVADALQSWGGDPAYVLGALLGLHRGLGALPPDWPVLTGDLGAVLADPATALRDLANRLLTELSTTGAPYATQALRLVGALLQSWEAPAGHRPAIDVTITGSGTYDDPWAVALPATGGEHGDLLVWLGPDGPPTDWLAAITASLGAVADGAGLAGLLGRVAAFDDRLRDRLDGRDDLGAGLDQLAAWLRTGDGLVPAAAQVPAGWTHGVTVAVPHARLPQDAGVVADVAAQVTAWGAPALCLAPQFLDRAVWSAVAPGAPHLDLRTLPDPRDVDLGTVTAVATHYTADLLAGAAQSETDQLERVVRRVAALTGAAKITLVAHSTAGVTARLLAAAHPELIAGIVTVGTPHTASPLTPLTDPAVAAAVRVIGELVEPIATSAVGATVRDLAANLAGSGALDQAARAAFTDGPAALAHVVDSVPGHAIVSALGGDPIGLVAGALGAGSTPTRSLPAYAGFGVRVALDVAAGEIAVDAHARVDLARLTLVPGGAPPARPATAARVTVTARRPGGWLAGAEVAGAGARVRWLEAGVDVYPGAPGGVAADPWLVLHDASLDGPVGLADVQAALAAVAALPATADAAARAAADAAVTAAREAVRAALDAVVAELAAAADGTPARLLLDLARAGGLVLDTGEGVRAAAAGILTLAQSPVATLAAHRADLFTALEQLIGGSLTYRFASLPLELALDAGTGALRLHTTADLVLAGTLRLRLDATLALASMHLGGTAALVAGPVELAVDGTGRVELTAAPWLDQLTLRPFDASTVERTLLDLVPRVSVSAAITVLLGAQVAAAIGPVDALLRDPVGWLRRTDAFGAAGGGLDGTKINSLFETLARAAGLDASNGLTLPGGYVLSAAGTDPCRIGLAGTFGVATTATLHVDLAVDLHPDRSVTPAATVTAAIALPGDWGTVSIAFSLDASGVGLLVTPSRQAAPIRLLPNVDGLGALIGGATALLPMLLQNAVTWLQGRPGPHDVLDVVLDIAAGFGIYDATAHSFTGDPQIATLRAMLQPGWLQTEIADSSALATLVAGLFGPGKIELPAGQTVDRDGNRVRWQLPLGPATVTAELGWSAGGAPQVLVGLTGLDIGPVALDQVTLGWLDGLTGQLRVTVSPGGDFAFFAPHLTVDAGPGLTVGILPLGQGAAADCAIALVPQPQVTLTTDGGVQLVTAWLVPLISRFVLPLVTDLIDTPFWTGGPTARTVLQQGGLLAPASGAPRLATPLPDLPHLGLGALGGLVDGATIHLTPTLDLAAVSESGRLGLRVTGTVPIDGSDIDVTVLLGRTGWTHDPASGITLWILKQDAAATPPFALDPGLQLGGLGIDVHGHGDDHPLVDGAVKIGGLAAIVFADIEFLDAANHVALTITDIGGAVAIDDAQIVVSGSDGDSFVAKVVPDELRAPFDLAVGYRNNQLEFYETVGSNADGIELTFPLDLDLFGLIFLRELFLSIAAEHNPTGVMGIAALSANASLGPIAVTVDRVGLRVHEQGGLVQFGFKAPDGFGVSMDVSVVTLGGFLLVDEVHGRYVGAVEIGILKKFDLTAIGIVTTKKPDGSPGFSLLLLITVQLPVAIPIGFGFFFAGAGGLLGLNRGMDVDRIRSGLRAGTADSILFPTDIVRRIDVIVRDLEESFPQQDGHFLIGPMAFIQWMNPALVTIKIGIVIEIAPQPNIAILGVLRLALPTPDEAIVDIKVAFLGAIDVAAGLLSFDASIYDSKIGYGDYSLSLEGDIAIRISWGAQPDLVASIGGFHPSYRPNAALKLPAMRRITLSLLKDNPRITLKLYFAVTSNTVQFGAQLELYAGVSGFSVSGDMGFDVLVQIAPFLIDAHMWAHLAVKAGDTDICSIGLDLSLRGPTPWIAHGTASISILFFSISVDIEATFGQAHATSLPSVAVLDRLLDQFRDASNWTAEISGSSTVTLLPITGLVVDAGGLLAVRQHLVPLATDIGLVGDAPPADISRATITALGVGTGTGYDDVTAPYAPSTFAGAPSADADRLRAPAYEDRPTGARSTGGATLVSDIAVGHQTAYERIVLDDPDASGPANPPVVFGQLVQGGAAGSSAAAKERRDTAERGSVLAAAPTPARFAVTALDDLTPIGGAALLTRSEAESRAAALGRHVQIVPEVQLVQ